MRRLLSAVLFLLALATPAFADSDEAAVSTARPACAEQGAVAPPQAPVTQMAQSSCRADCSSRRAYCVSTCRDTQCRAICNDMYQSCVSSCRR